MNKCQISGCRNLETRCKNCGRLIVSKIFENLIHWIDVDDDIPEKNEMVLVCDSINEITAVAVLIEDENCLHWDSIYRKDVDPDWEITHWAKLPDSAKEE